MACRPDGAWSKRSGEVGWRLDTRWASHILACRRHFVLVMAIILQIARGPHSTSAQRARSRAMRIVYKTARRVCTDSARFLGV